MAKIKNTIPVGAPVVYRPFPGARPEEGKVTRHATGKLPAAFVLFKGEDQPKYCYEKDLEIVA